MKTIQGLDVAGKKVIVRVDFNVPLKEGENGEKIVSDDGRIRAALPTIRYLKENGAKVILISHLGRPEGKITEEYRLDPAVLRLQELLGDIVVNCNEIYGEEVEKPIEQMKDGDVVMLGNLRFNSGEEENDADFAKKIAAFGDIYVNDAFAVSHRAHASVEAITHFLPSYGGFLLEKEVETLGKLIVNPESPFLLIMGGAKAKDKIGVINKLQDKTDAVLFGGLIANTFLKAQGKDLGSSVYEEDRLEDAKEITKQFNLSGKKIFCPIDVIVSAQEDGLGEVINIEVDREFEPDWKIYDIGAATAENFKEEISKAKTILWNGDMGMSEVEPFRKGTEEIAKAMAEATQAGSMTIICGGDTAGTVHRLGLADKMTYISTGGGAALEFLSGKELPGIKALEN
jgi:phosphoglycerate kinase